MTTGQKLQSRIDALNDEIAQERSEIKHGYDIGFTGYLDEMIEKRNLYAGRLSRWNAAKEVRELNFALATAHEQIED